VGEGAGEAVTWRAVPRQMALRCAVCDQPVGAARTLATVRGDRDRTILVWLCGPTCAPDAPAITEAFADILSGKEVERP
jgi:hypothetical protein